MEHRPVYEQNFVDLPPLSDKGARAWIVFTSAIGFLWTGIAVLTGNPTIAAFVLLLAFALMAQNGLQHVYYVFYFRRYAPGVATSTLLMIPTIAYLVVELVGADRGALSWELLDSFEDGLRGYVVWADDTPTVRQGADAFCGGDIVPQLRREPPTPAEVEQLKERAAKLRQRWQANQAEAQAQYQAKQIGKRQLNDLLKGIERRRKPIVAAQRETEDLLCWAKTGQVPDRQVRWIVDTRKMTVLSQLHDFARQAQQDTIAEIKVCVLEVLVERELARQRQPVSLARQSAIQEAMRQQVARLPWGQLTRRIFDQGGWVKRNPETHIMLVTLKAFDNAVIQAAMERLCERWNQKAAQMPCEDGVYTLQFACQAPPLPP